MVRPLTKVKRTGELYRRPPEIEAQLQEALKEDPTALLARARDAPRGSPDHLSSECLVHLIREAIRRWDGGMRDALLTTLLGRCEASLNRSVSTRRFANADRITDEVLSGFCWLVAKEAAGDSSAALDYYECRFDSAFRTLRIGVLRRERGKGPETVPLPDTPEDGPSTRASQEDGLLQDEILDSLPPKEREAVALHQVMGYEIESDDPQKPTVATRCGVSGRAIRKRLKNARERLEKLNKGDV